MRTPLKFAGPAARMILFLATVRTLWPYAHVEWPDFERLIQGAFIVEIVAGSAVAALLGRGPIQLDGPIQRDGSVGIILGVALAGTALVEMATFTSHSDFAFGAMGLGLIFALGLVMILAAMRRWKLLWLAMAALLGALLQLMWLVGLALAMRS